MWHFITCWRIVGRRGTVYRDGRSWFRRYEVELSALRGQKHDSAQSGVNVFIVIQKVAVYCPRNRGFIVGGRSTALLPFTNRSDPLWGPPSFLLDIGGSTPQGDETARSRTRPRTHLLPTLRTRGAVLPLRPYLYVAIK